MKQTNEFSQLRNTGNGSVRFCAKNKITSWTIAWCRRWGIRLVSGHPTASISIMSSQQTYLLHFCSAHSGGSFGYSMRSCDVPQFSSECWPSQALSQYRVCVNSLFGNLPRYRCTSSYLSAAMLYYWLIAENKIDRVQKIPQKSHPKCPRVRGGVSQPLLAVFDKARKPTRWRYIASMHLYILYILTGGILHCCHRPANTRHTGKRGHSIRQPLDSTWLGKKMNEWILKIILSYQQKIVLNFLVFFAIFCEFFNIF